VLYATGTSNPGIASLAEPVDVPVSIREIYRLQQFCEEKRIDLVVIGPEDPLADGYADALGKRQDGSPRLVFGPSKAAARIEADKAFAKHLMRQASIPTGEGRVFSDYEAAAEYVRTREEPPVVKAAGLAKGKGVFVPGSIKEAIDALHAVMKQRVFGEAGARVVIEERLTGPEVSVLVLCDGKSILVLPTCQDHKRLRDHDEGPNTGGMGAFCPTGTVDEATMGIIERDILVPTIDALRREEIEYRGVLYAGIMLTPAGPKVLEFNCRFGDPECQPLMARLKSDAVDLLEACAAGWLDEADVEFSTEAAVCVVMAASGYPEKPRSGDEITGLDAAGRVPGVRVYQAGTVARGGKIVTAGGRVLGVTALGADLTAARDRAYQAVGKIAFAGAQYRTDIAAGVPAGR
jgi:phosphoribosylamine--glycine ligase